MALNKKAATGIAVAAGVLALGAGIGVTNLAQAEPTPPPGTPSTSPSTGSEPRSGDRGADGRGPGTHGPRGVRGGELAKALAEKLGVTEAKVTEALRAVREEHRSARPADPSADPPAERRAELAKALAEKLGVDEAEVTTALAEIEAARNSERAAALKERLDAAVQAGTLTQAEADAVTKAVEKGVLGGGPR